MMTHQNIQNLLYSETIPLEYRIIIIAISIGIILDIIYSLYKHNYFRIICLGLLTIFYALSVFIYIQHTQQPNAKRLLKQYDVTRSKSLDVSEISSKDSSYSYLFKNGTKSYIKKQSKLKTYQFQSNKKRNDIVVYFVVYESNEKIILRSIYGDLQLTPKAYTIIKNKAHTFANEIII